MQGEQDNKPTPSTGNEQQKPTTPEQIDPKVPHIQKSDDGGAKAPNIGDQEKEENLHEIKMEDKPGSDRSKQGTEQDCTGQSPETPTGEKGNDIAGTMNKDNSSMGK